MITLPPGGTESGLGIVRGSPDATATVTSKSLSADDGCTVHAGWQVSYTGTLNGAIVIATGPATAIFQIDPSPNIPVPDSGLSWQELNTGPGPTAGTRQATLTNANVPSNPFCLALATLD